MPNSLDTLYNALGIFRIYRQRTPRLPRDKWDEVVNTVYAAAVAAFPTLADAPHEHTFQKIRVIEVASLMHAEVAA